MADTSASAADLNDHVQRASDLERRLADLEEKTRVRLIQAELKTEAVRAGMIDLDCLKLVDASDVAIEETGVVLNAAAVMQELKRAKPWLFGVGNSSSTAAAPPANPLRPRLATEMNYAEWQAARSEITRRR